jgi:hypothetical protein
MREKKKLHRKYHDTSLSDKECIFLAFGITSMLDIERILSSYRFKCKLNWSKTQVDRKIRIDNERKRNKYINTNEEKYKS